MRKQYIKPRTSSVELTSECLLAESLTGSTGGGPNIFDGGGGDGDDDDDAA